MIWDSLLSYVLNNFFSFRFIVACKMRRFEQRLGALTDARGNVVVEPTDLEYKASFDLREIQGIREKIQLFIQNSRVSIKVGFSTYVWLDIPDHSSCEYRVFHDGFISVSVCENFETLLSVIKLLEQLLNLGDDEVECGCTIENISANGKVELEEGESINLQAVYARARSNHEDVRICRILPGHGGCFVECFYYGSFVLYSDGKYSLTGARYGRDLTLMQEVIEHLVTPREGAVVRRLLCDFV